MVDGDRHWIAGFIWSIADDVLRDVYVRGKYRCSEDGQAA
jgi:type I restriction enzyme M protein